MKSTSTVVKLNIVLCLLCFVLFHVVLYYGAYNSCTNINCEITLMLVVVGTLSPG